MPDSESGREALKAVKRTLNLLVVSTVVLYLICAGGAFYTYDESKTAHDALCTLRGDLEERTLSSERFLAKHPKGIPGISPKVIREGITNQERTIETLDLLSC